MVLELDLPMSGLTTDALHGDGIYRTPAGIARAI
jgi:hypothetical protein